MSASNLIFLRGPYFLGVYDLAGIHDSGALFIRKVSEAVDPNLLRLLPVDRRDQIPRIRWPREVSITNKPDWNRLKSIIADEKRRLSE